MWAALCKVTFSPRHDMRSKTHSLSPGELQEHEACRGWVLISPSGCDTRSSESTQYTSSTTLPWPCLPASSSEPTERDANWEHIRITAINSDVWIYSLGWGQIVVFETPPKILLCVDRIKNHWVGGLTGQKYWHRRHTCHPQPPLPLDNT